MSEGGLSIHREGKELGAGRWEKGLSVEPRGPRGLKPGNNILILFQKNMCILCFILSSWQGEETCKGDACWWNACSFMGDKCQP
jgi:hypothetical protein